jgi:hypothetical protein
MIATLILATAGFVGCTATGDGVAREAPPPRPEDPSRIADPFPESRRVPLPGEHLPPQEQDYPGSVPTTPTTP